MFQYFYPDYYVDSVYDIDFQSLFEKGYRGILFDIDNTLVEHGMDATAEITVFLNHLTELGFKICLISNNKQERVERFNQNIKAEYLYKAHKPAKKGYLDAMKRIGTNTANTIFAGDQLFTDVWGAKKAGIRNYLVKPIDPREEIQIVIKRYFEKVVLYFYLRKKRENRNE